ncbi:hypothetical protein [Streptomyces cyanogenus]|uniref:Uncharacterized protein n=1 Tax=Streptomyces cyanogenus TaxID=80860 RepID=A0ABX7U4P2_STRCY|nr:hypothetical protein [Streptomyces cyanogenus]QTE03079.1 hypothetical protein S1361_37435 [Streptomyces cyanogenus]
MRNMDGAELLHREAVWLREIASRTRRYTAALPDLDDEELRGIRKAVLHVWIRYRYSVSLQFVTTYVAIAATAIGMAVASTAVGGVTVLFALGSDSSAARAPWWLFPVATWRAACLSLLANGRPTCAARPLASAHVGNWFVPAVALALVIVAVVAAWLTVVTALSASTGQQLITAAAGLFGAVLGLVGNRWILTIQCRSVCRPGSWSTSGSRTRPERQLTYAGFQGSLWAQATYKTGLFATGCCCGRRPQQRTWV